MGTIQCMKQREFLNRLFQISQLGGRPVSSFRPFILYHASKSRMCRNNTCGHCSQASRKEKASEYGYMTLSMLVECVYSEFLKKDSNSRAMAQMRAPLSS